MQINFFIFSPVQQTVELTLYTEKHPDTHPELVYADECPELWQQHSELTGAKVCSTRSPIPPNVKEHDTLLKFI
jgi:hypothetical protein